MKKVSSHVCATTIFFLVLALMMSASRAAGCNPELIFSSKIVYWVNDRVIDDRRIALLRDLYFIASDAGVRHIAVRTELFADAALENGLQVGEDMIEREREVMENSVQTLGIRIALHLCWTLKELTQSQALESLYVEKKLLPEAQPSEEEVRSAVSGNREKLKGMTNVDATEFVRTRLTERRLDSLVEKERERLVSTAKILVK